MGTQGVSYTYDSWGQIISIDGELKDTLGKINPYRYRGYRYDDETQLYYLQSRYYNPSWGRFINADAYGGTVGELLSHNAFAYCINNFINNIDPNGYSSMSINNKINPYFFKAVAIIATASSALINNINKQIKTISNAISSVGNSISNYQSKSKQQSKTNANTKTIANTNNNQ